MVKDQRGSASSSLLLVAVSIVIGVLAASVFFYTQKEKQSTNGQMTPKVGTRTQPQTTGAQQSAQNGQQTTQLSPTPVPLVGGPQKYIVSTPIVPTVYEYTLDDFDPKVGDTQKIQVKIRDTQEDVTAVSLSLKTDTKQNTYTLNRVGGTPRDGVWEGSWKVDDTHGYTYFLTFSMQANGKTVTFDVAHR